MNTDNSLSKAEQFLVAAFVDGMTSIDPAISESNIKYPNAPFTTPNGSPWIRITTPYNFGVVETDASGCYEINSGAFIISVFTPKGSGSISALSIAHQIKSFYTARNIGDIVINTVVVSPTSEPESSPWFGVNITVNFQFEGFTS